MTDDNHEIRELKFKLARANKTMGKQGNTIRALRGELAVTREEHSKIERGCLRQLEREVETLKELRALDLTRHNALRDNYRKLVTICAGRAGDFRDLRNSTSLDSADA